MNLIQKHSFMIQDQDIKDQAILLKRNFCILTVSRILLSIESKNCTMISRCSVLKHYGATKVLLNIQSTYEPS